MNAYDLEIGLHLMGETKFGFDLAYGQKFEKELEHIINEQVVSWFCGAKIECKSDRLSAKTGNMYFEYESRGKPSGLAVTESDYFAYDTGLCIYLFRTDKLKAFLRTGFSSGKYKEFKAGDDKTSTGLLVPIIDLVRANLR